MKKIAVLLVLIGLLGVLLPTQAQGDDQRITPENADQVTSLGIGLQSPSAVSTGALAPDWSYVVMGLASEQGDFQVWDLRTGALRYQTATQHKSVSSFAISPDGQMIATASADGAVQLWNAADGLLLRTLCDANANWGAMSVVFSPDGTRLASAGNFESLVQIWDTATGALISGLTDSANVSMIHFSPDGSLIAGGEQQRGTRVWDVASGELIVELPATSDVMYWSAWTPYGTRLLTGCPEPHGTLCLWEVPSGDLIWQTTETGFVDVRALAFNPHGSLLASAASNTTGVILDAATGHVLKQLDLYYNNQTVALAWSSDGAQLASIAQDGSLRFWGLSSSAGIHLPPLVTITPTPTGTITLLPPTFTPAPPTSIPVATQRPTATLIPTLHVGGRATVYVINNDTLNVRTEPAIETTILERLEVGAVVTLLEGPRDTNGYRWWRVRTERGTEGWAVESADGIQTLIPLAD